MLELGIAELFYGFALLTCLLTLATTALAMAFGARVWWAAKWMAANVPAWAWRMVKRACICSWRGHDTGYWMHRMSNDRMTSGSLCRVCKREVYYSTKGA